MFRQILINDLSSSRVGILGGGVGFSPNISLQLTQGGFWVASYNVGISGVMSTVGIH